MANAQHLADADRPIGQLREALTGRAEIDQALAWDALTPVRRVTMCLAAEACPDDDVLVEHEATVFVAPPAGKRLAGQLLDARTGQTGAAFYLRR